MIPTIIKIKCLWQKLTCNGRQTKNDQGIHFQHRRILFQGTSENGQISEGIVAFYTPKLEWISPINFYLKVNHSNGINKLV